MPEGYEVVADELEGHASTIEGLAGDVEEAVAAGMETIGTDTYGAFCQQAAVAIVGLQMMGIDVVAQCAETLRDTAKMLEDTARQYSETERNNRSTFAGGMR